MFNHDLTSTSLSFLPLYSSIKISPLPSHSPDQTLANLLAAIPQVVSNIKGGWSSIQSLNIKTSSSVSLPIWNCPLGDAEGQRWDGVGTEVWEEETPAVEGAPAPAAPAAAGRKGKKRGVEEVETAAPVEPEAKKDKKVKAPRPVSTKAAATPAAAPSPKAAKPAAPAPKEKEPKKVMAGKKAESTIEKKKTVSGAGKAAKQAVVGKKGGAKKVSKA